MMSVEKSVPDIRFKGFSGEWAQRPFGDCFDNIPNNTLSRADLNYEHGIAKNVHYGDVLIKFGEILDASDTSIPFVTDENVVSKQKHAALKNGDIVIADAAEDSTVGKCTELFNIDEQVIFSGLHTIAVRPNLPFASKYLGYYLNSSSYHDQLLPLMQGTKVLSISKTALKNTSVNFPSANGEQIQIGNYFEKLDSLINQHQQKHDKLSNIKKAMLEKMFPKQGETMPEIRFKGFSGEWKTSQLSELALFNPKEELPVTFKYVDLESVKGTSLLGYREEPKESAPSRAQRLAKKGDVFFQTVRPYQKNNYLFNMEEIDFVFSTGYAQLRPYYDGNFLLNLIQRDPFVKDVLDNCTGTSYPAINASVLASLEVIYPETKSEQTAIGNTFQKLDALINQHQQQITKLNNIKQACLSKMFI